VDPSRIVGLFPGGAPSGETAFRFGATSVEELRGAIARLAASGSMTHASRLTPLLAHPDPRVAADAETALWNIWMRAGTPAGVEELARAVDCVQSDHLEQALSLLTVLCITEPVFAEAHHQRAIVLHLLERTQEAQAAYRETLRANPEHFAAAAGLGHVYAEHGELLAALQQYRRALRLNPRLTEIREAVFQIEAALRRRVVA
jgi:tetratricopeptide (TPR) repeat protein